MKYRQFTIKNYRAIVGPMVISVRKEMLLPIIGINESGKTTILQAIFAFDHHNDSLNDGGRHLKDVENLYQTASSLPEIEAEIEISKNDLREIIDDCREKNVIHKSALTQIERKKNLPTTIKISRNLRSLKYTISPYVFGIPEVQDVLAQDIVSNLPYILYFDDFRDKIADKIEIPADKKAFSEWGAIIEQLFQQTDSTFSIRKLASMEERQRKTVLSKVEKKLNATLTREWQTFRLDDREALKISIEFKQEVINVAADVSALAQPQGAKSPGPAIPEVKILKSFLKLDVIEVDSSQDAQFFFISDRSKGFYWFFNFVMKLEFNSKVVSGVPPLYLLDEPGSYLHAFAQRKLCVKLRHISKKSWVAYCTHSHYLLDPEVIPITSVQIAEKDGTGSISLTPITSYQGDTAPNRSALQPLYDALQIKPFALDIPSTTMTIITEGIYDYFALELFRGDRNISFLPSVGADSIKYYISLMIAWCIDFRALWDNDQEGLTKKQQATDKFGEVVAQKHFRTLTANGHENRCIMQDLFEGADILMIRCELELPKDCSFEKTLQSLFYSTKRHEIVDKFGPQTRSNFEKIFANLQ